jgi:hypothetical protein
VLESAAGKVASLLSEHLNTPFARHRRTDTFQISRVRAYTKRDHMRLILTAGWVDLAEPLELTWAPDHKTPGVPQENEDLLLKPAEGYVRLYGPASLDGYVRLTYTAGFPTSQADATVYEGAPDWLVQAFVLWTGVEYTAQDTTEERKPVSMPEEVHRLLANRVRWQHDVFTPIDTDIEEPLAP